MQGLFKVEKNGFACGWGDAWMCECEKEKRRQESGDGQIQNQRVEKSKR